MSEFKGTKGSWKLTEIDDDNLSEVSAYFVTSLDEKTVIACVGPSGNTMWSEDERNGFLLAAAPDLLEVLKAVLSVADRDTVEFDMARAAIAKATVGGVL